MAGKCRRARPRPICAKCGARILNGCMERAGLDIRYDPRTLKEQGIERDPEIHIGPKAQVLDEKGYEFESHDQIRGDRSIPYTLFDEASRAAHNAHIKEANGQKEKANGNGHAVGGRVPQPPAREDVEKRTLREAQSKALKEMYAEQRHDRDALRLAQEPAKIRAPEMGEETLRRRTARPPSKHQGTIRSRNGKPCAPSLTPTNAKMLPPR